MYFCRPTLRSLGRNFPISVLLLFYSSIKTWSAAVDDLPKSNICLVNDLDYDITVSTVVLNCCKGDKPSQWEYTIFWPL